MASRSSATASAGTSILCPLLTVAFVTMKLAGIGQVASWSWWWVLAPIWLPIAILLGILAIVGIVALIASILSGGFK